MPSHRKVVWSEGLFIQPQHFQQQERYFEHFLVNYRNALNPYSWGFVNYQLNSELFQIGKISLESAQGIFPDGTPFHFPHEDEVPPALAIPNQTRDQLIYLALPLARIGQREVANQHDIELLRYRSNEREVVDNTSKVLATIKIPVARLNPILLLESQDHSQYTVMPIARILECHSDGKLVMDENFIPPVLDCHAATKLEMFLKELKALLQQRAETLAQQIGDINRSTNVTIISDFLLLQLLNQYEGIFDHFLNRSLLHPEQLYLTVTALAGSLSTFGQKQKRPVQLAPYQHNDLFSSFKLLLQEVRYALSVVAEPAAMRIPLLLQKFGIEVATIHDQTLFDCANFILAVRADVPTETLLQHFPSQAKIGPVDQIRQLINLQLPGIELHALPVSPPQIPFNAKFCYFEIQPKGELWEKIKTAGNLAIHTSGNLPNLKIELWTIRGLTL